MKEVFVIKNISRNKYFTRILNDKDKEVPLFSTLVEVSMGFTAYTAAETLLKTFDVTEGTRFCIEKHFIKS